MQQHIPLLLSYALQILLLSLHHITLQVHMDVFPWWYQIRCLQVVYDSMLSFLLSGHEVLYFPLTYWTFQYLHLQLPEQESWRINTDGFSDEADRWFLFFLMCIRLTLHQVLFLKYLWWYPHVLLHHNALLFHVRELRQILPHGCHLPSRVHCICLQDHIHLLSYR